MLPTTSQVEVVINGATVRSFRLPAGRYDLRDLPLGSGVNDVVLRITNDVGEVEEITYSLFFDSALLGPGIDQFSASFGLPVEEKTGTRTYDTSSATFSGNYRRGITNTLTLGGDFQANGIQQLLGAQGLWATGLGTFEGRLAGSYVEGANADLAARLGYRVRGTKGTQNRNFDLSLLYTGQRFAALGSTQPNNSSALDTAVRYSQRLPMNLSGSIGGTHKLARNGGRNSGSVSGSLSRQLTRGANLNMDLQRRRAGTGVYENRAFISLNVSLPGTSQNISTTRDSQTGVSRLDWTYRPQRVIGGVAATAGLQRDAGDSRLTGELSRTGYRSEASLSHDVTQPRSNQTESERVSSARLGTALVFAGGHFAMSRPVTDGFAIVVPHSSLKGQTVGINPRGERAYIAEADAFGPAVIPDLSSYQVRRILIDVPDLAIGAELGQDVFDVVPTIRSGTVIEIGTSASVLATFKVVDEAGEPIPLQAGELRLVGSETFEPLLVFSDRAGVMTSDGLSAGVYELTLFAFPDLPITFEIGDDAVGIFDLGTFQVKAAGDVSIPPPSVVVPPPDAPAKPDVEELAPVREAKLDEDTQPASSTQETKDTEVARAGNPATDTPATAETPAPSETAASDNAQANGLPRESASAPQNVGYYRAQLAAFRTPGEAETAWDTTRARHVDLLGKLGAVVVEVDLGARGVFYRLQVGPLVDLIDARRLCRALQEQGQSCLVIAPAGAGPVEQPAAPGRERAEAPITPRRAESAAVPAVPVGAVAVELAPEVSASITSARAGDERNTEGVRPPRPAHRIQLAALQTAAAASAEWARLRERHPRLLAKLSMTVVSVDLGAARGIFHRLQAGPLTDGVTARALCAALRDAGQACLEIAPPANPVGSLPAPNLLLRSEIAPTPTRPPALRADDRVPAPEGSVAPSIATASQEPDLRIEDGQPAATVVISSAGSSVTRTDLQLLNSGNAGAVENAIRAEPPTPGRPQFLLQLATSRSSGGATAELDRLRRDLGRNLDGLETHIVTLPADSDTDTRYRIEAGRFDTRDAALAACRPIQSSGRPCLVVEAISTDQRLARSGTGPLSLLRSPK